MTTCSYIALTHQNKLSNFQLFWVSLMQFKLTWLKHPSWLYLNLRQQLFFLLCTEPSKWSRLFVWLLLAVSPFKLIICIVWIAEFRLYFKNCWCLPKKKTQMRLMRMTKDSFNSLASTLFIWVWCRGEKIQGFVELFSCFKVNPCEGEVPFIIQHVMFSDA